MTGPRSPLLLPGMLLALALTTGVGGGDAPVDRAPEPWPALTPLEQYEATMALRRFGNRAAKTLTAPIELRETTWFLLYGDLEPSAMARWADTLDRVYLRLAVIFGVEPGANIWRGKAVVFIFRRADDFRTFERKVMKHEPGVFSGVCHSRADGRVVIAFHAGGDRWSFARLLVHETVHGFLHRYRTPAAVPSWLDEGLATLIAARLVPDSKGHAKREHRLRRWLTERGRLPAGLFTARAIPPGAYDVAAAFSRFLLHEDRKAFLEFIDRVKDGEPWRPTLEGRFERSLAELVAGFGRWYRVGELRLGKDTK